MTLLVTGITLDMAQVLWRLVFLCYLGSIDPSGWMAFPMTALFFLEGLGLRLLSRGGGIVLSLVFIRGLVARLLIDILFVLFC